MGSGSIEQFAKAVFEFFSSRSFHEFSCVEWSDLSIDTEKNWITSFRDAFVSCGCELVSSSGKDVDKTGDKASVVNERSSVVRSEKFASVLFNTLESASTYRYEATNLKWDDVDSEFKERWLHALSVASDVVVSVDPSNLAESAFDTFSSIDYHHCGGSWDDLDDEARRVWSDAVKSMFDKFWTVVVSLSDKKESTGYKVDPNVVVTWSGTFDAAHKLDGHQDCGVLHGHTYSVKVIVEGEVNEDGMVVDSAVIRDVVMVHDHACLNDCIVGVPPTVEHVSSLLCADLCEKLIVSGGNVSKVLVEVREGTGITATCMGGVT